MSAIHSINSACAIATAILSAALATQAQTPERWVTHGPWGGSVTALVPSHHPDGGIYAGLHDDGVYFIPRGANIWERRGNGLADLSVRSLVQHPTEPDILYAGTDHGVYWTTDGASNWEVRSGDVPVTYVDALAFDPSDPQTLYAVGIWDGDWAVYKTTDAGQTWLATGPGIPVGIEIRDILVDPTNCNILYAATEDPYDWSPDDVGVYKSLNGGDTWLPSGAGLYVPEVQSLAFAPASSQTIYAGVFASQTPSLGGVYVSHDGGDRWARSGTGLPGDLCVHEILALEDPNGDVTVLFAAMSYAYYSSPLPPAGWESLLYQSVDDGQTWQQAADGIAFPNTLSIATDRDDSHVFYVGTLCGGAFRSTDAGATYTQWSKGLQRLGIRDVTVHPENSDTVYAAVSFDGYYSSDAGVYASFDGGLNWEPRLQDLYTGGGLITQALAVAPAETETVYAAHCGWHMFKSIDEGLQWNWRGFSHGLDAHWLMDVVVDPRDPNVAYTCSAGYPPCLPEIYKTEDCGETWQLCAADLASYEFECLAIDPTNSDIVYAGSGWEGVWKSIDGGDTWALAGTEIIGPRVADLVVDPERPLTVYAADSDWEGTGVHVSHDGGDSWQLSSDGLTDLTVWDLAIDSPPGHGTTTLYASTHNGGVFRRVIGDEWEEINEGLGSLRVRSLALGPLPANDGAAASSRALYAGTDDGVYRRVTVGDLDGDGDVDLTDLAQLLAHYGTTAGATYEDGDVDTDGDVDLADLAQLLSVYGMDAP